MEVATSSETSDVSSVFHELELLVSRFASGIEERANALWHTGPELDEFQSSLQVAGTSTFTLAFQILLVVLTTIGVFRLCRRWFERPESGSWRRLFSIAAATLVSVLAAVVVQRFLVAEGLPVRTLRIWIVITVSYQLIALGIRALVTRARTGRVGRLSLLVRDLLFAVAWCMFGVALTVTLRLWGVGPGLLDLFSSFVVVLPACVLFISAACRNQKALAAAVAGSKPRHRIIGHLARIWPFIVICFLVITFISMEISLTLGVPLPNITVFLSIVIVFLAPHLDVLIAYRAKLALGADHVSIVGVALWQTSRFAVVIIMLTLLGAIWASPLASGVGLDLPSVALEAFEIGVISLAGAFLWNILGTVMSRIANNNHRGDNHGVIGPTTRLGTLVPLLRGIGKATVVALVFLSTLVTMGVNVWPLVTGLSVFGLAIGFGSQTLVKDIVSGLFFLVDDAFRIGEYIETSGAKGTVEKISVRSVTLRNPRGPVATVPYGQISKIVNFSRDYAIDKIQFRVAFDTDVELLRKLFKKIGLELMENPEIAPDIIEAFKSQGISNVEDGTLVVRGKFVAKPGRQTVVRRHVMKAVHQAFLENGIKSVPKPLTGDPVAV